KHVGVEATCLDEVLEDGSAGGFPQQPLGGQDVLDGARVQWARWCGRVGCGTLVRGAGFGFSNACSPGKFLDGCFEAEAASYVESVDCCAAVAHRPALPPFDATLADRDGDRRVRVVVVGDRAVPARAAAMTAGRPAQLVEQRGEVGAGQHVVAVETSEH